VTATGGYHCHGGRDGGGSGGGNDDDERAVSLNFLAGIRPSPLGDFDLVALGLIGARRAPVVDRPENDMHWRVNYGAVAGIQFHRFLLGVRWTPEGLGVFVGMGGAVGAGYLFGGDNLGGVGGFVDRPDTSISLGGDMGIGGKAFAK